MTQQYEYLVHEMYADDESMFAKELDYYGDQGWQLVQVCTPSLFSRYSSPTVIFRREKNNSEAPESKGDD